MKHRQRWVWCCTIDYTTLMAVSLLGGARVSPMLARLHCTCVYLLAVNLQLNVHCVCGTNPGHHLGEGAPLQDFASPWNLHVQVDVNTGTPTWSVPPPLINFII